MSSDMFVDVPAVCSRTGRKYSINMPLSAVTDYVAAQEAKKAAGGAIAETLTSADAAPDLVVYWKGQVHVLTTIHENSHPAISRYVNLILKNDVYEVPPQRTRAAKDDSEEITEAVPTGTKRRGRGKKGGEAVELPVEIEDEG
jgi:hypothetical protein